MTVELLSPGTEAEDLGQTLQEVNQPPTKWQVYEQILRVPYYAVFDRYENDFRLYQLVGTRYEQIVLDAQRYWFEELGLSMGIWQGEYEGVAGKWLRWQDAEGNWILTAQQRATQAQQQAEEERQKAVQERQKAERLAAKLCESGVDPDAV